jgi:hypothetical protein
MADVDALFEEFVARYHTGEAPDALEYIERAGDEADELAAMIAAVLEAAPPPVVTELARERSVHVPAVAALSEGDFTTALSALRRRTGETRASFSRRLADRLGVAHKAAKVKRYYADLENGLLSPIGLQRPVIEALAELLGTSPDLVDAARTGWRTRPTEPDAAFPRAAAAAEPLPQRGHLEPDEVDELFLGGV